MWALNNQTPFAAERTWVRDKQGAEVWLVAVKGTFDIQADGTLILAEDQEEVVLAPEFSGDPQSSSLLADTDLPHRKAATDVILFGHAYAPNQKPATKLRAAIKVGSIDKQLQVIGDRVWENAITGPVIGYAQPFLKMPITYERAYGGMDLTSENEKEHDWELRNPAGCGFSVRQSSLVDQLVPNIADASAALTHLLKTPKPAGFGPIAGHWSPRRELTGTYDEQWEKTKQPLLPDDFDEQYYQCAPKDQQVPGYLKGGELVELYNLTPSGRLQFRLPRISLSFSTHFDDGSSERHRAALHTVILRPDVPRVVVVWHTHLECHHKVLKLNQTVIRVKERIMLSEKAQAAQVPV